MLITTAEAYQICCEWIVDHCTKLQAIELFRLLQLNFVSRWCRVAKHTLLPNETVYTNVFFPVPQAEELYIRGFLPSIDNTHLTHHLVAYLCVDEMAAYTDAAAGVAVQPESAEHNGVLLPVATPSNTPHARDCGAYGRTCRRCGGLCGCVCIWSSVPGTCPPGPRVRECRKARTLHATSHVGSSRLHMLPHVPQCGRVR